MNHVRKTPQIDSVPRKSGYSGAPPREVPVGSYAQQLRDLVSVLTNYF